MVLTDLKSAAQGPCKDRSPQPAGYPATAIRRVMSMFVMRDDLADGLVNYDHSSVDEVLNVAGKTDEAGRSIAESTSRAFQPTLIPNRVSGRARVNVLQLRKLVKEYVGVTSRRSCDGTGGTHVCSAGSARSVVSRRGLARENRPMRQHAAS